jgi:hypothetical protein
MLNTRHDRPAPEEVTAMLDQFHDHIDRAITAACSGRWERTRAYLAAAGQLLTALPADLVDHFELAGHLDGVARGLGADKADEPLSAA